MKNITDITVSVAMVTYDHEAFIAEAIESVLKQQTHFKVELVIGEDCSTDGTSAIAQVYAERFPERIRLLLSEHNQGMMVNFTTVLNTCRGRYVALLDGDDYWIDSAKLQKQVDFLESHPECAICFHDVVAIFENQEGKSRRFCSPMQKEISTLEDLLLDNFIPACSCMFRRGLFGALPAWFVTLPWGDWPLHILNAQYGDVGYIDDLMGVYRVHSGGVSQSPGRPKEIYNGRIRMFRALDKQLDHRYHALIKQQIAVNYYRKAALERRQGSKLGALRNLVISLGMSPGSPPVPYSKLIGKMLPPFTLCP
jgi:glycosyltransferase involved in cell wall biosynthesis